MIDLHCHILPGIDDGAKTLDDSLALLRAEKAQGVDSIVFTPHYNADKQTLEEFLENRAVAVELLTGNEEFKSMNISYKVGAEIYFTVGLADKELDQLCFTGTDYVLIEFPVQFKPHGLKYALDNVINRGYTPIIAHVERYPYIAKDPTILYDLVSRGCLAHINAETLIGKGANPAMANKYIKWGLVHFLCSDCHSMKRRPPNLEKGYSALKSSFGKNTTELMIENSRYVFNGSYLELENVKKPRSLFGAWI